MIQRTGKFTVSVLSQSAQFELFKHFGFQSGRDMNKFEKFEKCARGENGIYYITEGTNAYISVSVNKTEDLGSHTMFIGEITDMEVLSDIPSVTYEYYQNHIKPKPQAVGKTEDGQTIWRCRICGYEYVGEELPDDLPVRKMPILLLSNRYCSTTTSGNDVPLGKKIDLYRSRHAASVNWDQNTVEKPLPTLAIHASFHRMYDHRSWERSTHNNYNYAHRVPDVNALSFLGEIP